MKVINARARHVLKRGLRNKNVVGGVRHDLAVHCYDTTHAQVRGKQRWRTEFHLKPSGSSAFFRICFGILDTNTSSITI